MEAMSRKTEMMGENQGFPEKGLSARHHSRSRFHPVAAHSEIYALPAARLLASASAAWRSPETVIPLATGDGGLGENTSS